MKSPRYIEVDGLRLPPPFHPEIFRNAQTYVPEKGRIVVATYPRCGTTWTQQIVMLILRKGVPPANANEYFSLLPYLEITPLSSLQDLQKDAIIKTHLPFNRITFSSEVKYIYVARHPADCMVSFYYHTKHFPMYFFSDGTLDEYFEVFISGKNILGDYFDHLLSWYEHCHEPNILLTTYESLKLDNKETILKIAKFIGNEYYNDLIRDDEEILRQVLKYSSIDFMRETVDKYWDENFIAVRPMEIQERNPVLKTYAEITTKAEEEGHFPVGNFVRKGAVGDGKLILSENQKMRLESRIREKCSHSDVMDLWKNK